MLPFGGNEAGCRSLGGMSNCECFRLRPSPAHDAKWRRADLQDTFREPLATRLWFHLLADCELETCWNAVDPPQADGDIGKDGTYYTTLAKHDWSSNCYEISMHLIHISLEFI